ncbi:MAG: guanylate kinase [Gemmatimonadetes bacterium]|nr:guanylate kinase [Gemmatimonadota bacterium]
MGASLSVRPCPLVLSAPSGAGKTSIARALLKCGDHFAFSISATTRPPRPGERDGVDYFFVNDAEFQGMVERGELAEWAVVHGQRYGTPKKIFEDAAARGIHVLLDIDIQGARQIRESVPDAVLIFILPPSGETLVQRIAGRGGEDRLQIRRRLLAAHTELQRAPEFDYIVVNDQLDEAVKQVLAIVDAERKRSSRMVAIEGEIRRLQREIDQIVKRSFSE